MATPHPSPYRQHLNRLLRARSRQRAPWALITAGWVHLLAFILMSWVHLDKVESRPTALVVRRIAVPLHIDPQVATIPEQVLYVQADRETKPPDPDTLYIAARDQRADQSTRVVVETQTAAGSPSSADSERDAGHDRFVDPVVELRQALGWGALDRASLARRPEPAEAQGFSQARPANDALALSWQPAVNARGTPLGRYIEQIERIVSQRWQASDLDLSPRAIGIQGQVTLQYTVRRDGRVVGVQVARSSGVAALDDMARAAVPRKLPRIPGELGQNELHHQLILRYRNPLVAATKAGFRYDDAMLQFGTGVRLVPGASGP